MINQFWQKPHDPDAAVITVKDWNQQLAPNIKSEILTQISAIQVRIDETQLQYVRKADYNFLEAQYYTLKAQYDTTMQILAIKGLLTEEDIKEFHDSRKLAKSMAEAQRFGVPNGFVSAAEKAKLNNI